MTSKDLYHFFIVLILAIIFCLILMNSNTDFQRVSMHVWAKKLFKVSGADSIASGGNMKTKLKFFLLTEEIGFMSAYYDNRTHKVVLLGKAWVNRINGTLDLPAIDCILRFQGKSRPVVVQMNFFTTYIFYCPLSSKEIPQATAIAFRNDFRKLQISKEVFIPVLQLPIPGPTGKFAVCGPTLMQNYSDWMKFVQFVEWYLLMGAERIFLYDYEATALVENLVDHYVNENIIELMHWPREKLCVRRDYFCQLARINDCVHRTRYRYKFVAVVDIDELIYPQLHENLTAILDHYCIRSKSCVPRLLNFNPDMSPKACVYKPWRALRHACYMEAHAPESEFLSV